MSVYSVRATPDEKMRHLPGDDLIAEPLQSLTHAITVRCRSYRRHGLPEWVTRWLVPPGHFVMQRKQLLGIARRAEQVAGIRQPSGCRPALRRRSARRLGIESSRDRNAAATARDPESGDPSRLFGWGVTFSPTVGKSERPDAAQTAFAGSIVRPLRRLGSVMAVAGMDCQHRTRRRSQNLVGHAAHQQP
jgi:hypothetical protein